MASAAAPIRLGLMPPLSGLASIYGGEILRAAQLACAEINAGGGLLGRRLQLCVEDDGCDPGQAVQAARRLVREHGCCALIGNLLSNVRIAVAEEVAEQLRLPYLNFSFYEGSISERYFFHFAALPNQQIDPLIPWLLQRHGPKFYFAGHNYEWPRGSIDAAKRALAGLDGECLGESYHGFSLTAAERDQLLNEVARSGANVFMPFFAGIEQLRLLQRFAELGLGDRMALASCHFDEVQASQMTAAERAGIYSCNSYFMSLPGAANAAVLERLAALPEVHGLWPHGDGLLSNFGEGTYVCVKAFAAAVVAAGQPGGEPLLAALRTVEVEAPQGRVRMDPLTQHAWVNVYLCRCEASGAFSPLEAFGPRQPSIPPRYGSRSSPLLERGNAPALPTPLQAAEVAAILDVAEAAILACEVDGSIVSANAAACQLFGYRGSELIGRSIHQLVPPHLRSRHAEYLAAFAASAERQRSMGSRGEIVGYRRDGSFISLQAAIARLDGAGGRRLVVTLRDIAARKLVEQELRWRGEHDLLTGLANRDLIRDRLQQAIDRARRDQRRLAVLFIDLDGFKLINDSYGRSLGDRLLRQVAMRLLQHRRPGDSVGRLSGDEFVMILEQLADAAEAGRQADRINAVLAEGFMLDQLPLFLGASIGIALDRDLADGGGAEDLLRCADAAMYQAKQQARGGSRYFSRELDQRARQRIDITQALHGAIERAEFSLRLQPIVDASSGHIEAGELLLRWQRPQSEVAPADFIPIAELTGAILEIGRWVFRRACELEVSWRRRWGERALSYLAVNLSTRQLANPALDDEFAAIIDATGARPEHLLLEITETSLMSDVESNLALLRRLAALGLRIAVDDFGTGYSSLAQLTRLPVSVLKVDRAFVSGSAQRVQDRAVVRAITGLGQALGLTLVAEGVETREQLDEVCRQGCRLVQGFLFHRPLPEVEFAALLEAQSVRAAAPS